MCGIAGILRAENENIPPGYIAAMVETLRHRGPDGDGSFFAPGIALGHTRLAIIDLSTASSQPFVDDEAGLALVFNGEIYNYVELRAELRTFGHDFRSSGDVEVLLRAYEQWGHDCLRRLNGMFAFAIWDNRKRELFLARDRFGEKPLYLARSPRGLVFASEMKAILAVRPELRRPNRKPIFRYLSRGDLDLDEATFFDGIESLPAAHYMVVDAAAKTTCQRYWLPASADVPASRAEATEEFRSLLFDAVRIRLRSDVPVGSSLSGGLDSSSIVATINAQDTTRCIHQSTFSARFRSRAHDEGRYINLVTRQAGAEAHEVWVEPDDFLEEFARLQWHQEEPIASASPYAQWCVMKLAHASGTTVLLDGQGADEMLAGYDQAHGMFWAHWARRGRVDTLAKEVVSFVRRYRAIRQPALFAAYYSLPETPRDRLAEFYYRSNNVVSHDLHRGFRHAHADASHPFSDRLRNELVRWQSATQLPEILRYADRNSMAFGREARLPFLDHRLIEYSFGLPPEMLLRRAVTKVVLRDAMRGIVPDEILERRDKLAYSPPQRDWVRGPLRPWVEALLTAAARRDGYFNPRAILELKERLPTRPDDVLTWRVISAEAWFQRLIDSPGRSLPMQAEISPLSW